MNEKINEVIVRAKEVKRREKKAGRKEQKLQEEMTQIKSDADLKVAEASRELNSLKPKLELLGDTINVTSMSLSLEEFEEALTKWLEARDREEEDALKELLKDANRVANSLRKQRDQANAQLNKYANEKGAPGGVEVSNYELRHTINALLANESELEGKLEEAERQNKELREGKSRVG